MSAEDIIVDDSTPLGTKALRDYLDFAKRGILSATDEDEREPESDFEIAVANAIRSMGFEVKPQLGVAGFFIDMAVRNPDKPGEFLAGIESDGATYHSGFSVRDRDRIRQEILESLGWKDRIYRIWSTDWFSNPRRQIERLRIFLEERRRLSALERTEFEEHTGDILEKRSKESGETLWDNETETEVSGASIEDVFVEVGDRVTYCLINNPKEKRTVQIVDSESNPRMGIVNERTPLAKALLGLSPGDVGELIVDGHKRGELRVMKVQSQRELML